MYILRKTVLCDCNVNKAVKRRLGRITELEKAWKELKHEGLFGYNLPQL